MGRNRWATGDLNEDGSVVIEVAGAAPAGEEGALKACFRFIEAKRNLGEQWSDPMEVSHMPHVDARATSLLDQSASLEIQVVRAVVDQTFWRALGEQRFSSIRVKPEEAANLLKKAIELKVGKIPVNARQEIVLLLDASDVPGAVLNDVVEQFQQCHGTWCNEQMFKEIWITGPWQNMSHQLSRGS